MSYRTAERNFMARKFGSGIPTEMSRAQLAARAQYLREHGRRVEALNLTRAWLAAKKELAMTQPLQETSR
jgi:hypothetical protein